MSSFANSPTTSAQCVRTPKSQTKMKKVSQHALLAPTILQIQVPLEAINLLLWNETLDIRFLDSASVTIGEFPPAMLNNKKCHFKVTVKKRTVLRPTARLNNHVELELVLRVLFQNSIT